MSRLFFNNLIYAAKRKSNPVRQLDLRNSRNKSLAELQHDQKEDLVNLIRFVNNHVPYYQRLFSELGLSVKDFRTLNDLNKLPILQKQDIIDNLDEFTPFGIDVPHINGSTGGSTGEPLRYRISNKCNLINQQLLYRGFGYAGYKPYDKLLTVAGGSLVKKTKLTVNQRLSNFFLNKQSYSSYGVGEEELYEICNFINTWKPRFIRGYANSLLILAEYIDQCNLKINSPKAMFSTAEMMTTNNRKYIERVFSSSIYDQYGLNDGGVSAFEDSSHNGFLVDTERAIMEVVDHDGNSVLEEQGTIVATSLHNYSFPFLRYNTNDTGTLTEKFSSKKSPRLRLNNLGGRVTDILKINGKSIGSPVLTVLMGKVRAKQYQFVQYSDHVDLILSRLDEYTIDDEEFLKESLFSNMGLFDLRIHYDKEFISSDNKHKFIVNRINK